LAGEKVETFSDSLNVVKESVWRANQTATKVAVQQLINSSFFAKIDQAKDHIVFANASFSRVKVILDDLWKAFGAELVAMQAEVKEQMTIVKADLGKYAQAVFTGQAFITERAEDEAEVSYGEAESEINDRTIPLLMMLFCFVEVLGFWAFFTRRLRKIRSAKKME
jgi:hypothetical protein